MGKKQQNGPSCLTKRSAVGFCVSRKVPLNCRSLDFPGFPVERCGFGQLYVVAGESGEVGNPGTLGGVTFYFSHRFGGRKAVKSIGQQASSGSFDYAL
jgi:hypothetical protein